MPIFNGISYFSSESQEFIANSLHGGMAPSCPVWTACLAPILHMPNPGDGRFPGPLRVRWAPFANVGRVLLPNIQVRGVEYADSSDAGKRPREEKTEITRGVSKKRPRNHLLHRAHHLSYTRLLRANLPYL